MPKYYSIKLRIINIITLVAFVATQTGPGYAEKMGTVPIFSHIRAKSIGENPKDTSNIAGELYPARKPPALATPTIAEVPAAIGTAGASGEANAAAEAVISNGLLARHFVFYNLALQSAVNPNSGECVVAYDGFGADVSNLYLATNFTKAYCLDQRRISAEKLEEHRKAWVPVDNHRRYFITKYEHGFNYTVEFEWDAERFIIQELQAMGIEQGSIKVGTDAEKRTALTFRLPNDDREREMIFVRRNMLLSRKGLNSELRGIIDVYYQKGVHSLAASYRVILPSVAEWVKPGGFLIINPYTECESFVDFANFLNDKFFSLTNNRIDRAADSVASIHRNRFYGWKMSLWQKQQVGISEGTAGSTARGAGEVKGVTGGATGQAASTRALAIAEAVGREEIKQALRLLRENIFPRNAFAIVIGGEEQTRKERLGELEGCGFDGVAEGQDQKEAKEQLNSKLESEGYSLNENDFILILDIDENNITSNLNLPNLQPVFLGDGSDIYGPISEYLYSV